MDVDRPLRIDLAAAAEELPEEEFRVWAREQRVFISSVMQDLKEERLEVARRVEALGAVPVLFERFGGRDDPAEAAYLHEVASSSIYVGILGRSYGKQLPSRYSATHEEYLEAERQGLRICVWVSDDETREGHQEAFVEEVRTFHTTGRYSSAVDLADDVERRLRRIGAEDLSPWVKLGTLIFRARSIAEFGDTVELRARIRNPDVLADLEAMRPDRWGTVGKTSFAGRWTCRPVRVEAVETVTGPGTAVDVRVMLESEDSSPAPLWDVTFSEGGKNFSPMDLTESALRSALFNEEAGLGEWTSHMADLGSPLRPLADMSVPEEVAGSVARLLLVEALVCAGRASRVSLFRLGPLGAGKRRLELAWRGIPRHRGADAETRRIDGFVTWPPL